MSDDLNPLTIDVEHPSWYAFAECRGLTTAERDELFFPGRGEDIATAKAICEGCPVRAECLEHAMAEPERFGVWGGLSERERRRLRRSRPVRVRPPIAARFLS